MMTTELREALIRARVILRQIDQTLLAGGSARDLLAEARIALEEASLLQQSIDDREEQSTAA